jgi:hypothetical protein
MLSKKLLGSILIREDGTYTAVCPTYPNGYYPDAKKVEEITAEVLKGTDG